MNYSRLFLLLLISFSLIILSENVSAYTCSGTNYAGSGDWLINDNTSCSCSSGENITINGNVYVYGTGNFTLNNCILWLNQTTGGQYGFIVNDTASTNITNSLFNSTDGFFSRFEGNSNNTISNSVFLYPNYPQFFENSISRISNSNFSFWIFFGNSSSTILNSVSDIGWFYDNSSNSIINSTMTILVIQSSISHNLTISNLSPGNFTTKSIKADNSMFTVNLTNVNMTNIDFLSNSTSNNTIINSTFFITWFGGNSSNTIINSTFTLYNTFLDNSKNFVSDSEFNYILIHSSIPQNLTISNLASGNSINKYIKADDSNFTINLTNVNVNNFGFETFSTSNNTISNSSFDSTVNLMEYSTNTFSNVTFDYGLYAYQNSTNSFYNITINDWANFYGNSTNTIIGSKLNYELFVRDNSITKVISSTLGILYIFSSKEHNLTISNLSPGNFTYNYIKANGSEFSLNLTNVNITYIGITTAPDPPEVCRNTISNSTFNYDSYFNVNSINTISNSTFNYQTYFLGNSTNDIFNSEFNILVIESSIPQNLTISNLASGNSINNYIKADDSNFTVNFTNVNITSIGFEASEQNNNTIINSTFNSFCEFSVYSINTIINSSFNYTCNFHYNSNNTIINSTFYDNAFFFSESNNTIINSRFLSKFNIGYLSGVAYPSIYFINAVTKDWSITFRSNATIKGNYTITGIVDSWETGGNVTRYFPLYVKYNNDNPISGATVSIKDNSSSTVWQGSTNSNGYVEPIITFNATNYGPENFTLYVQKDGYTNSTDIHFLTNTSILLTLPYVPPSTTTTIPSGGPSGPGISCKKENQSCTSNATCCSGLYCMNSFCKNVTIVSGKNTTTTTLTTTETTITTTAISLTTTTTIPVKSFLEEKTTKIIVIGGLVTVIVCIVIISYFMIRKPKMIEPVESNTLNLP